MDRNIEDIIDLEMQAFDAAHHSAKRYMELGGERNWMAPLNARDVARKSARRWRWCAGILAVSLSLTLLFCLDQSKRIEALNRLIGSLEWRLAGK